MKRIEILYYCDNCKEEFRFEPSHIHEDKHFCTERCLKEYLYNNKAEILWNKCHRITKYDNNYYIDDYWKIITSFKIYEGEYTKSNIRKACLVLCCRSEKGYEEGSFSLRILNTCTSDFERPRPRNTSIYCNSEDCNRYVESLILKPEKDIKYFEEFLQDAIENSDSISDR